MRNCVIRLQVARIWDQREFKGAGYERDQNLVVVVVGLWMFGVWIVYGLVMER